MRGFETYKLDREADWGKSIVVVAASGWETAEGKARAIEVGFDVHRTKPVDDEDPRRIVDGD